MTLPGTSATFRDPIHGYIDVLPHERAIIDTAAFQRLRRIRQLGLSSYVYHGAEHSRFGHLLGAMHLAGLFTKKIIEKNRALIDERFKLATGDHQTFADRLFLLARLAGLLHDIGHAPFSHVADKGLFPPNMSHEDYSALIIQSDEVGSIIDRGLQDWGIGRGEVAQIISHGLPEASFLNELISSPWDVDKMDYLLRDSHYCGVRYGLYDINRLIDTYTLDDSDPAGSLKLAIEEGGIHAVEGFVLSRYFMFTQVYYHDVRRAYDFLLAEFIKDTLQKVTGQPRYPENVGEYLTWDDSRILAAAVSETDAAVKNHAWRLTNRKHPKTIIDTGPHADPLIARNVLRLPGRLKEDFPNCNFWWDHAADHPERFRKAHLPVKLDRGTGGAQWRSLTTMSKVLAGLDEIVQVRVYADVRGDQVLEEQIAKRSRELAGV